MVVTVDPITSWNLPRMLLELVPESAPLLAGLAAEAHDLDPAEAPLPPETPPRLEPEYQDRAKRPMSVAEVSESYEESPPRRVLNSVLASRFGAAFGSYQVFFEFKYELFLPALREPTDRDLIDRCCQFLELAIASQDRISQWVHAMVIVGLKDEDLPKLLPSAGPLLTEELSRSGYPVL